MEHPYDDVSKSEDIDIPPPPLLDSSRLIAPQPAAERIAALQQAAAEAAEFDITTTTTIKVSNIPRSANEDDLRAMFSDFGHLTKFSLPRRDGEGDRQTRENKGYAIIAYEYRVHAERAFEALRNRGFDHMILNLEWIKPSDPNNSSPRQFYSGYGQRLAQDTNDANITFMAHGNASRR